MTEAKRTRGIKVLVKRSIWLDGDVKPEKVKAGSIVTMTKEQLNHFGSAVTRDLPESESESESEED